jgi:hypothetical protein
MKKSQEDLRVEQLSMRISMREKAALEALAACQQGARKYETMTTAEYVRSLFLAEARKAGLL